MLNFKSADNTHKIFYTRDDGVEDLDLSTVKWTLSPPVRDLSQESCLVGATVRCRFQGDGKWYAAMVYKFEDSGHLKVFYFADSTTGVVDHKNWAVVKPSPCVLRDNGTLILDDLMKDAEKAISEAQSLMRTNRK